MAFSVLKFLKSSALLLLKLLRSLSATKNKLAELLWALVHLTFKGPEDDIARY